MLTGLFYNRSLQPNVVFMQRLNQIPHTQLIQTIYDQPESIWTKPIVLIKERINMRLQRVEDEVSIKD